MVQYIIVVVVARFNLFVLRLDNVVKEYSGATANMFTAIVCSILFPEKFQVKNPLRLEYRPEQTKTRLYAHTFKK